MGVSAMLTALAVEHRKHGRDAHATVPRHTHEVRILGRI